MLNTNSSIQQHIDGCIFNISLLLGDVKILEHIQLAANTSGKNIDFKQIDKKTQKPKAPQYFFCVDWIWFSDSLCHVLWKSLQSQCWIGLCSTQTVDERDRDRRRKQRKAKIKVSSSVWWVKWHQVLQIFINFF